MWHHQQMKLTSSTSASHSLPSKQVFFGKCLQVDAFECAVEESYIVFCSELRGNFIKKRKKNPKKKISRRKAQSILILLIGYVIEIIRSGKR